ncbi:recombinase family protein [Leptolyngbya sp. DQ-M1]|uniref:recombinase family protein n=1 Tax=Leptolyngbya sp. DQ-M1 TaxID=2933920 RepID=UPI0032968236
MRAIGYIRLSRAEQNNGVSLERQIYNVKQAAKRIGAELPEDRIYCDLISGRKNDRPNFQIISEYLEHRSADVVIFNRVDRMGRDLEALARLGKQFERTEVGAFVCNKGLEGDFINWKDPADWEFWASSAVAAEKESRVLSYRTSAAWEFNRHMSLAAYRVPFGYQRNTERRYERDPARIEAAIRLKEIFFQENGNISRLRARAVSELGLQMSPQTYRDLLTNPVWRGHTGIGWDKAKRTYKEI